MANGQGVTVTASCRRWRRFGADVIRLVDVLVAVEPQVVVGEAAQCFCAQ